MEKIKQERKVSTLRQTLIALGLGTGVLSLAGCTNYEGTGNDFKIVVEVDDTTHQSITGRLVRAEQANGKAEAWFSDIGGTDEFHDNCDCHGFWRSRKQYGELHDYNNDVISPEELAAGSCVQMVGKIREQMEGKVTHERPVYERAEVIPCG